MADQPAADRKPKKDIRGYLSQLGMFLRVVVQNTINDRVFFRAGSLAFRTILSMVPLTMVIFAFGGFDQLGVRLMQGLGRIVMPENGDQLLADFLTFTDNARRLGGWGTLFFLIMAILLFNAMETHLNDIFRAKPRKEPVMRVALYIASLALISLVFGVGFGPISGLMENWGNYPLLKNRFLGQVFSTLGTMAGMMTIFWLMNAARVRLVSSLIGSFIGSIFFQAAKFGFTLWTTYSVRQSVIYGSLVFFPLLLIWLNVAWIVILISAEITYADQMQAGRTPKIKTGTPLGETDLGWRIFLLISDAQLAGGTPPDIRTLAGRLKVDERRINTILERFIQTDLVHQVNRRPNGYVPAVAISTLKASRVMSAIVGLTPENGIQDSDDGPGLITNAIRTALGDRTVESFLKKETGTDAG